MRQAPRAWVQFTATVILCASVPVGARGQQAQPNGAPNTSPEPFKIIDNSFLVEEAFNQDPGTFQNIYSTIRANGVWAAAFTQEWPLFSETHQVSYALLWEVGSGERSFDATVLNYRLQVLREGRGTPAFAPRVGVMLPSAGENGDPWGLQINLPFSKRTREVYWHWNAGMTWMPSAEVGEETVSIVSPSLGGSAIYALASMLHLMLEVTANFVEFESDSSTRRASTLTASPGVRGGWNITPRQQVVLGVAVPTTWSTRDRREAAALLYASYELPFRR
jgi:hypothetical protein